MSAICIRTSNAATCSADVEDLARWTAAVEDLASCSATVEDLAAWRVDVDDDTCPSCC